MFQNLRNFRFMVAALTSSAVATTNCRRRETSASLRASLVWSWIINVIYRAPSPRTGKCSLLGCRQISPDKSQCRKLESLELHCTRGLATRYTPRRRPAGARIQTPTLWQTPVSGGGTGRLKTGGKHPTFQISGGPVQQTVWRRSNAYLKVRLIIRMISGNIINHGDSCPK